MADKPTHEEIIEDFRQFADGIEQIAAKLANAINDSEGSFGSEQHYVEWWEKLWAQRDTMLKTLADISQSMRDLIDFPEDDTIDAARKAHSLMEVGPEVMKALDTVERYVRIMGDETKLPTDEQRQMAYLQRIDKRLAKMDERLDGVVEDVDLIRRNV